MKISTIASLIGLVSITPTFAADNINLEDIVVTASRIPQTREAAIADMSVIDAEEIQHAGQSTLVELLVRQPGIEITSSGGAGTISSIFMRATNSGHVVVLIDGLRVDSATLGSTAFENLPVGQIDRIEILRGPASSLYGQDAIGGVIQIFTKKGSNGVKFSASLGYGSYDTKRADFGISGNVRDTRFALNASSLNTNSFSAINTKNKDYNDNDANRNLAFSGNVTHQIETGHEIGFQFLHTDGKVYFDNSCPLYDSSYNCVTAKFDSRTESKQYTYSIFSKNQFTDFWLSKVRIGEGVDVSKTFDLNSFSGGDYYQTKQFQLNWQNDFKLQFGILSLLYDGLEQRINSSKNYDVNIRTNDGIVASYLLNTEAHSLQISLRHDSNSQFGGINTGNIGYGYNFTPEWRVSTSYGTAFKAPTFNDLYYPLYGNPNLKSEQSRNIETSLRYQSNDTNVSATLYHNKIHDLISYDPAAFTLGNINEVSIKGLTLSASGHFNNFSLGGNIDIQSPKDDKTDNLLVRRANRHASTYISYAWGNWRFGAETIASSIRYNDPANAKPLGGYSLLNATADYKLSQDWSIQARANNILDKKYVLGMDFGGEAYNTPGANLFVNIRYQPE